MIGIGQGLITGGGVRRAALGVATAMVLLSALVSTTSAQAPAPAAPKKPVGTNPFAHILAQGPPTVKAWHNAPGVKIDWINTGGKEIKPEDLRGKFVLLDFWTYCCINCMHILPELKKLEHEYPNELVVIGVHSAKFDNERDSKNITDAVLRYEIEHPVANDSKMAIWNEFNVRSWPSLVLIDPDGKFVANNSGEFTFEQINPTIKKAIDYYAAAGKLDTKPLVFAREVDKLKDTPLRYPGKVLADAAGKRLFIADSNHNRIVVTSLEGKLLDIIGSGDIGFTEGTYDKCSFNHPQGMVLVDKTLYVADTENHMLRKVDLEKKLVTTISGNSVQGRNPFPGAESRTFTGTKRRWVGPPKTTELNSPWDLWVHDKNMYIAMAGPHQIWKMPLTETEIGPFAGNGREDIVDGPHLPEAPYAEGASSFAQPSGLASDGTLLFVADSEGSSIRAVPFDTKKEVFTPIGTSHLSDSRLFTFGDRDGPPETARLQHPLGVAYLDGLIYVADTYNNKIRTVDKNGNVKTLAGSGAPGLADQPAQFDEPAGLSIGGGVLYVADTNNHAIRTVDVKTGKVGTLVIDGLNPPPKPKAAAKPAAKEPAAKVETKVEPKK
jgi:thiol-disulfide isomerase/thioredoxin